MAIVPCHTRSVSHLMVLCDWGDERCSRLMMRNFNSRPRFILVSSCVWWALVLSRTKGGYLFRAHVGGTAIVSHPHSSLEKSPENDDDTTCEWEHTDRYTKCCLMLRRKGKKPGRWDPASDFATTCAPEPETARRV